jgi:plastocyanin
MRIGIAMVLFAVVVDVLSMVAGPTMEMMGMDMGGASSPRPDRTIAVNVNDEQRFVLDSSAFRPGETVAFTVSNTGHTAHEFALGGAKPQVVLPSQTKTLVYTFAKQGSFQFVCHITDE